MKKRVIAAAAILLAALMGAAPARAWVFTSGPAELSLPAGWEAEPVYGSGGPTTAVILNRLPYPERTLIRAEVVFDETPDQPREADGRKKAFQVSMREKHGLNVRRPREFADGRGFWRKASRREGRMNDLLLALVYYQGGRSLSFEVFIQYRTEEPVPSPVGLPDLPEKVQAEILAVWKNLGSGNPAWQELLEKVRAELPPEFFQQAGRGSAPEKR